MRFNYLAPLAILSLVPTAALCSPVAAAAVPQTELDTRATADGASPDLSFAELWTLTNRFWTAFMYPNNIKQTEAINSTIFSKNVLGRVDVSRTFNGRELNTEYIFGLFSALDLGSEYFSLLGIPQSYNIVHFTGNQNVVSCSVIVDFYFKLFGFTAPVEMDVWLTFNSNKQISQYDATFRWLDWQMDWMLTNAESLLGVSTEAEVEAEVTSLLATSICQVATDYCTGDNLQYNSSSDCYTYLTEETRFGSSYELGMDTLLCRMVHQNMVPFRPDVHCSHIGPTGGSYCVDDLTYSGVVTQSYFKNTPMVPYGYQNKNKTIAAE